MMERINLAISRYQQRIGKYDRQFWEQSVEQEVLKRLRNVPRKTAKVNPDLIDIDLFGGSAFCRSKPQYGWLSVSRRAILRLLFLPLYHHWWRQSTGGCIFSILFLLYVLQVGSLIIWFTDTGQSLSAETLSVAHVASPCITMFILALVHSQIMAIYETSQYSQLKAKTKSRRHKSRSKRSGSGKTAQSSGHESMGSYDTGIYLNANTTASNGLRRRQHNVDLSSADNVSPVCQPSEISTSIDDNPLDSAKLWHASFQKTSNWLLQQDASQEEADVDLERATQSSIYVGSKTSDVDPTPTVVTSHSEPLLSQNVILTENDIDVARSSMTVIASSPSEQAFVVCHSTPHISTPASHNSSRQKTRQLRFSCAVEDSKDSEVHGSHALPSKNDANVADEADGQQWITHSTRNDVEELSMEDGPSLANSNTSLSDTCNSSFKSSTEDLANSVLSCINENSVPAASGSANATPRVSSLRSQHSPGLRHRKRRTTNDSQHIYSSSPARQCDHARVAEEGEEDGGGNKVCQECDSLVPDAGGGIRQSAGAVVTDLPRVVSSDDDDDDDNDSQTAPRISPSKSRLLHQHHARRPRLPRVMRSNEKFSCHNTTADVLPKDRGVRVEGWRSSARLMDVRLLESTGISSADSDGEAARLSAAKSPCTQKRSTRIMWRQHLLGKELFTNVASSEWEDTGNTELTSGSVSETWSQASSSHSDLSAKGILGSMAESSTGQGIHVSSVMNNLASNTDRVSCMIWEPNAVHKVDLTVLDIGWTIMQKVDNLPETCDYLVLGIVFSLLIMFTPTFYRIYHSKDQLESLNYHQLAEICMAAKLAFGHNWRQNVVIINGLIQRLCLSLVAFFFLSVAERTFKQRLMYAKNFCYLTSSRRAKKYDLPHFRLNKVRNIKTWLSLRSFLKKRGPQRSVEHIVSAAFLLAIVLVSILCIGLLQDYGTFLDELGNWELVMWCMCLGVYLLRFITLGTKINKKYRNFSVLITEQINLYLHMEQKPHKKEELMVANSVLKLAEDLLKELESPFKISGLSANPFLYNITKVVVLSAFSAVLTELLGFKLKLYKIKIRA